MYEGQWTEDLQDGKGALSWEFGSKKYEGDFSKGKRTGKGVYESTKIHYEGDFIDGKFHGEGSKSVKEKNKTYKG